MRIPILLQPILLLLLLTALCSSPAFADDNPSSDVDIEDEKAEHQDSTYQADLTWTINLKVYDLNFEELVRFEDALVENVPVIIELDRVKYSDNTGELVLISEISPSDMAEYLITVEIPEFPFEIVEYEENLIALSFSRQAEPETTTRAEPREADDGRLRVAVESYGLPYNSWIGNRAINEVGQYLSQFAIINLVPNPRNPENMDWLVRVSVDNVDFNYTYTPPIWDDEEDRIIVQESWTKYGRLDVTIQIVDQNTGYAILTRSFHSSTTDYTNWRYGLSSDTTMINSCWNYIMGRVSIELLDLIYRSFEIPTFVVSHHPELDDRAITNLGWGAGMYVELPMRLYIPNEDGSWTELCKVTVKEVYNDYSVIELEDKWYQYFEFGQWNNILWPVQPDR